jgi:phosphonate metabolism protein PhnN/1,5-bisphosphokinase (PRPP-forming)
MQKSLEILRKKDILVNILQRVITRPPDVTEDSVFVSETEFMKMKAENKFALFWYVYNNWYGCPRILLDQSIQRGEIVLVNISRAILFNVRKIFPQSKIVLIEVPFETAEKRMRKRGREKGDQLSHRTARIHEMVKMPPPNKIIKNDGDLHHAVQEMVNYLEKSLLENCSINP